MVKISSLFILAGLLLYTTAEAQHTKAINLNTNYAALHIKEKDSMVFSLRLKKDDYYNIIVEQQGIDLVVDLKDKKGTLLQEMDSPNGNFGPEKIDFSPDANDVFFITVKPLPDSTNPATGNYSVLVKTAPQSLGVFTKKALTEDLDILKNGFLETHVGLWYNTYAQFDSMYLVQKAKIKDNMTALQFYQVLAPLVAFTKEGHSNIKISDEINTYFKQHSKFFTFFVKVLNNKVYVINNVGAYKTKGLLLNKINGKSIDSIMNVFLSIEPADGYNYTSKYRWVETSFSRYYLRFFEQTNSFDVELTDPATKEISRYKNVPGVSFKEFNNLRQKIADTITSYSFKRALLFKIDSVSNTAMLTINTFGTSNYKDGRKGFKKLLEEAFGEIRQKNIQHLIIDIRKNEGGAQGMEDHLLSYLIDTAYAKYKYVELPAFPYSFYQYTSYKDKKERKDFEDDLDDYFYRADDGRFIDKPGKYKGDAPAINNFKGDLYILISGLTFSGGSEFAALAKNYTHARFIGEETGGGYYGNTSGEFLQFTLPNSKLPGRIPLFKFVIEPKANGIPFGHGVLPDYSVQQNITEYLEGYDTEMEYTKKMIRENKK